MGIASDAESRLKVRPPAVLGRCGPKAISNLAPSSLQVLQALTRKFAIAPDVNLAVVAEHCPGRFTGADMYALCSDAWMRALRRRLGELDEGREGDNRVQDKQGAAATAAASVEHHQGPVMVTQRDFLTAAASLMPSLSTEEVAKYEQIRQEWEAK